MNLKRKDPFKLHSVRIYSGQGDDMFKGDVRRPRWLDVKQKSNYNIYRFF